MAALTTFHTLHRQMERLRRDADSPLPGLLLPLFAEVAAVLSDADGPARNAAEAQDTVFSWAGCALAGRAASTPRAKSCLAANRRNTGA